MTLPTILIADDDRSIRTVLTQALGRAGYQVRATGTAATLWRWVEDGEGDLVITDVVMPDENGLDLIPRIKRIRPDLRVVVMSAQSTLMTAVKAAQRGAFEYLPKPFDLAELMSVVARALAQPVRPAQEPAEPRDAEERLPLIGRSASMQEIYRTIARLTTSDLTVMITGESGTGKDCSATNAGLSPAPPTAPRAGSNRPTAAPCFWMKSATCRPRHKRACCACCRKASSPRSVAAPR
jgi:two-component system nitrogen regulation response regulator GlnG